MAIMHAKKIEENVPFTPNRMSEAEYLAFADTAEFKHEYSRGRVLAMSGGSIRHSQIAANIIKHLGNLLDEGDCDVLNSDARVAVLQASAYRYPDVTVFCGEPAYLEGRNDTLTNPVLLVEVLSPDSALRDYNEKLEEYTQIESLQAYLIVTPSEAKIERYLRHEGGQWLYQVFTGLEAELALPALGCALSLAQVYRRVSFDAPEDVQDGGSTRNN